MDIRRLRATAIDISKTACDMTFINTTLWGIPTEVFHGDALAPLSELRAGWRNIHWVMDTSLLFRPVLANLVKAESTEPIHTLPKEIVASVAAEQGQPPTPEVVERITGALQQQTFAF